MDPSSSTPQQPEPASELPSTPSTPGETIRPTAQSSVLPQAEVPSVSPTAPTDSIQPAIPTAAPVSAAPSAPVAPISSEQAPQPIVPGQPTVPPTSISIPPSSSASKKRWILPTVIVAVLLVLAAGGFVFGYYLPNQPGAVYASGLNRTGKALDTLVNYSDTVANKHYKSWKFDGTFSSKGGASFDGTLAGSFDDASNASLALKLDVMGEKVNANLRSVTSSSKTPDLYLQAQGIKPMLDSFGMSAYDNLDGQWIAIDHTLLDSYASELNQSGSNSSQLSAPSSDALHDAFAKVQTVNKDYLFTTDGDKAVLTNEKYLGKVTKDGRPTMHYTVSCNKAHLKAYIDALGKALDSSSLNSWSKTANDGKSLSAALRLDELKKSVDKQSGTYTFDVWIDTKTKLVHAVQFTDPSNKSSVLTITQNYTGGDTYPFTITATDKDDGSITNAKLGLTINARTNVFTATADVSEGRTDVTLHASLTPSSDTVKVTAPSNAEPIVNVIGQLFSGSTDTSADLSDSSIISNL